MEYTHRKLLSHSIRDIQPYLRVIDLVCELGVGRRQHPTPGRQANQAFAKSFEVLQDPLHLIVGELDGDVTAGETHRGSTAVAVGLLFIGSK